MATEKYKLHVLLDKEEGEWVALAMEMDIRGYGATKEAALSELGDLVINQIAFAKFKNQPELIWHPAEDKYWTMYNEERRKELRRAIFGRSRPPGPIIQELRLPEPHVIDAALKDLRRDNARSI